jgi:hypothetical protein
MPIFKMSITLLLALLADAAHAATCPNDIIRIAPNSRYQALKLSNNSEVQDLDTRLIWQRCSLGQVWDGQTCTGNATRHTWRGALELAKQAGNGWRVPNIKELQSLLDRSCFDPAINIVYFPNTKSDHYLSSSPKRSDMEAVNAVWGIDFDRGDTIGLSTFSPSLQGAPDAYVRLVRFSQ